MVAAHGFVGVGVGLVLGRLVWVAGLGVLARLTEVNGLAGLGEYRLGIGVIK